MRILFVNHTGLVGGAERSLLELLAGLPREVAAVLACPPGSLADAAGALGVPVRPVSGTRGSLRLDPLRTTRALLELAHTGASLRRLALRERVDLVHACSVRAGLAAALAPRTPLVVDIRDCLPATRAARVAQRLLGARSSMILANSRHTATAFEAASGVDSHVIHPPVDLTRFNPRRLSREQARERLGLAGEAPVLGVVAQLTPWKGQDDAIRALALLRRRVPSARLLVVGAATFVDARFDNRAYAESLRRLVRELGLEEAVTFLEERDDVPDVLRALDLLLAPSWEEPFGRTVLEGMAMALPVLATDVGGPREVIEDGVSGILLPPREPQRWMEASAELISDPARRAALGERARERALGFGRERYVTSVVSAYRSVLDGRARQSAPRRPTPVPEDRRA